MTSQALLELATRLATDLKRWSEEVTERKAASPEELLALQSAAQVVARVTEKAVILQPDDQPLL